MKQVISHVQKPRLGTCLQGREWHCALLVDSRLSPDPCSAAGGGSLILSLLPLLGASNQGQFSKPTCVPVPTRKRSSRWISMHLPPPRPGCSQCFSASDPGEIGFPCTQFRRRLFFRLLMQRSDKRGPGPSPLEREPTGAEDLKPEDKDTPPCEVAQCQVLSPEIFLGIWKGVSMVFTALTLVCPWFSFCAWV